METIYDFVHWAGGQRKAAKLAGVHESNFSRILHHKQRLTVDVAQRMEVASGGFYRAADLLGLSRADPTGPPGAIPTPRTTP